MATYSTSVRTSMPPAEAFAFMADLRNFAVWDPGVTEATQVEGDGPGPEAVYDVTVKGVPSDIVLRYRTLDFQPPDRLLVRADTKLLSSVDEVTVVAEGAGSVVTYDAELTLKGVLKLFDPGLRLVFGRIGDRAATGLRKALGGEIVKD